MSGAKIINGLQQAVANERKIAADFERATSGGWLLNKDASEAFVAAMNNPPAPSAALTRAYERYKARAADEGAND